MWPVPGRSRPQGRASPPGRRGKRAGKNAICGGMDSAESTAARETRERIQEGSTGGHGGGRGGELEERMGNNGAGSPGEQQACAAGGVWQALRSNCHPAWVWGGRRTISPGRTRPQDGLFLRGNARFWRRTEAGEPRGAASPGGGEWQRGDLSGRRAGNAARVESRVERRRVSGRN